MFFVSINYSMEEKLISLCMIVKNEEKVLARCLDSVASFVDEIIIVDTGSTDSTKDIAKKFTDKVYDFVWQQDFAKARNYSFSLAKGKYVMWLDADDVIQPKDLEKLLKLKEKLNGEKDVYMLKYNIAFDEQGNPTFSFYRERILKNDGSFIWQGAVHEVITTHGAIEYSDIGIDHLKIGEGDSKRNLNIYRNMIRKGKKLNARENYYYARELFYHQYYKKCIDEINKTMKFEDLWSEDRIGCIEIKGSSLLNMNRYAEARKIFMTSFDYSYPRAKILCLIGKTYLEEKKYIQAIFWFENALNSDRNKERGGFFEEDYFTYYPAINLSVCYYYIGDIKKAEAYNNLAFTFKPFDSTVLKNREFFNSLKTI